MAVFDKTQSLEVLMLSFESAACACLASILTGARFLIYVNVIQIFTYCHTNIHVTIMYVARVKRTYVGPDLQVPGCDLLCVCL